jgi:hypothetical protein
MKKITSIIIAIIVLVFVIKVNGLTGTNDGADINITRGQIDITPIIGGMSTITLTGSAQSTSFLENSSSNIVVRSGVLASNTIPDIPILLFPNNDTYTNDNSINFLWSAEDQNNDTLTSSLELYNDSALTNIYLSLANISNTNYNLSIPEDIPLFWRVRSNDSSDYSNWSALNTITIDRTSPTSFNLTSPINETSSTDTSPELTWLPPTETNLDNYSIEFCSATDCGNATVKGSTTTTDFSTWDANNVLDKGTYYWRVKAIDKANNQNISSLFIYSVEATVSETIISTTGGGGGETSGSSGTQLYSLSIISPPDVTIYSNDTLTIPLVITNPARMITLNEITLAVATDSEDVAPILGTTYIQRLRPKEQKEVPLTIVTHTDPGTYGLTITAKVKRPFFEDRVRILANLIEKDSADNAKVSKQLGFAKDLLDGNPECLDLKEYIVQAESSLSEGKHDQAINLIENAIGACQKLISTKTTMSIKQPLLEIPYLIKENKTIIILAGETLAFILVVFIGIKIIRKKKTTTSKF